METEAGEEEDIEEEDDDLDDRNEESTAESFGYIDDAGNVVYVNVDAEEEGNEVLEKQPKSSDLPRIMQGNEVADQLSHVFEQSVSIAALPADDSIVEASYASKASQDLPISTPSSSSSSALLTDSLLKFFTQQKEPCPRINPCLMIRGNSLLIYGG